MVQTMCNVSPMAPIYSSTVKNCPSFQAWFWFNVIVDVWFIVDVCLNLRTGYMVEGHFVSDDITAIKHCEWITCTLALHHGVHCLDLFSSALSYTLVRACVRLHRFRMLTQI